MDKIEKLIKELCPNGVERHKLGDICDTVTDFTAAGSFASNAKNVKYKSEPDFAQLVRTTDLKSKFSNTKFVYVDEHAFNYLYRVNINEESIILPNVGNCGEVYYVMPKDLPYAKNVLGPNALLVRSSTQNNRFLYHLFQERDFQRELGNITSNTGQSKFNKTNLKKIVIPIPPLEIQEEIVKILDKFTDYVTELTTELTLRQKQYHYYRDMLLSFKDSEFEVQRKRIGDILIKGKGTKITASQMRLLHKDGSPIRVFAGGKTFADVDYGEIPEKDIHKETAIIVKSRGIIDFEYYSKPFTFKNEFWSYTSNDNNINLRYIYHYLIYNQNHFQEIANKMQMPQISSSDTENFIVPIPKIEIQSRIVQVLDNFDAVCNDLNIGLPKEIDLRQKQYEFFRDKLLTFAAEGVYTDSTVQYRQDIIRLLQWVFGPIKVKLGSICDLDRGKRVVKSQLDQPDGYPVFQNSLTPLGYYEKNNRQAMTTFIVCAGAAAEVGYSTIPFWAADDIFTINNSENVVSKYIYHILLHQQNILKSKVRKASIPRLSRLSIENIQFILPNLNTQIEIVNKLDQFDAICFDLSHGLPKEIELRQKQYEYYRDKLLSFD